MTGHKQTTDGVAYTTSYTYNLGGALVDEIYPSGRVVKNVLDSDGDLALVQSKKNSNAGFWNYAGSLAYDSAGNVPLLWSIFGFSAAMLEPLVMVSPQHLRDN